VIKHINELKGKPRREGTWRVLPPEEAERVRAAHRPTPISPRTSPAEYTRILLDAKEGRLSEGEANRRITKQGGPVKVRPLPKPPR
jgi:hypothetical protein